MKVIDKDCTNAVGVLAMTPRKEDEKENVVSKETTKNTDDTDISSLSSTTSHSSFSLSAKDPISNNGDFNCFSPDARNMTLESISLFTPPQGNTTQEDERNPIASNEQIATPQQNKEESDILVACVASPLEERNDTANKAANVGEITFHLDTDESSIPESGSDVSMNEPDVVPVEGEILEEEKSSSPTYSAQLMSDGCSTTEQKIESLTDKDTDEPVADGNSDEKVLSRSAEEPSAARMETETAAGEPSSDEIINELKRQLRIEQERNRRLEMERNSAVNELEDVRELKAQIKRLSFEKSKLKAMVTAARTAASVSLGNKDSATDELESAVRQLHSVCSEEEERRKSLESQVEELSSQLEQMKRAQRESETTKQEQIDDLELAVPDLECLPPNERALWLTLSKLRQSYEQLDEERQLLQSTCHDQSEKIALLEETLELRDAKVTMLTGMVKQNNAQRGGMDEKGSSFLSPHRAATWKRTALPFRAPALKKDSPRSLTEEIVFSKESMKGLFVEPPQTGFVLARDAPVKYSTGYFDGGGIYESPPVKSPTSRLRNLLRKNCRGKLSA